MADGIVQVNFRWGERVRDALFRAAEDAGRSAASQSEEIVSEWLRANGYLKAGRTAVVARRRIKRGKGDAP